MVRHLIINPSINFSLCCRCRVSICHQLFSQSFDRHLLVRHLYLLVFRSVHRLVLPVITSVSHYCLFVLRSVSHLEIPRHRLLIFAVLIVYFFPSSPVSVIQVRRHRKCPSFRSVGHCGQEKEVQQSGYRRVSSSILTQPSGVITFPHLSQIINKNTKFTFG